MTERAASRLLLAPDARTAERELLAEVERMQSIDPLARLLIVVPSRPLRLHLLSRLVESGRARLGFRILTLRALAATILESTGDPWRSRDTNAGELLFPRLVERLASEERALAGALARFEDGYTGVAAAVRDLIDAGLDDALVEHAGELLDEERAALGNDAIDRARALVRVAGRARAGIDQLGLALEADRLRRAAEVVAGRGSEAVPATRAIVHGFSDATGTASDLLERLFRAVPTVAILLDPSPLDAAAKPLWSFGSRLRERFEGSARVERIEGASDTVARAPIPWSIEVDGDREASAAVRRSAAAVRAGAPAERIAIVARELGPYRSALERAIDRHALPASGIEGGEHPAARRARAWIELLERRGDAAVELVLGVAGARFERAARRQTWEIRQTAVEAGARRLSDLAGAAPGEGPDSLAAVRRPALELRQALDGLARAKSLGRFGGALRALLAKHPAGGEIDECLTAPLELLEVDPLAGFAATPAESRRILLELWAETGRRALGGGGSGVAILSVTEARGLTFDRLLVLGMARERFPRRVRSDPFLPDPVRLRLRALLPDLPVKAEGHDEERFLFAQLLTAAPEVELSSPERDDSGHELARSTLLDELERAGRLVAALPTSPEAPVSPALDLAIAESLSEERLAASFGRALTEADERFGALPGGGEIAAGQLEHQRALLRELAADPRDAQRRARPGPYFGFIGERPARGDLRREPLSVTTLEKLSSCGWQTFLERLLRIAPPPVGADEIPSLPPHLVGSTVHQVLEQIAPAALAGGTLAEALTREPVSVPWPEADELERIAFDAATRKLREEGIDPALFARSLVLAASRILDEIRAHDWPSGVRQLLAVEVQGVAFVGAFRRELRFRADRCEREDSTGGVILTDYKTGKPISTAKGLDARRKALATLVAQGESLQLPVYVLAGGQHDARFSGRLLFARAELGESAREARLDSGDELVAQAPWDVLYAAWDGGTFLPRLLDADLSRPWKGCDRCAVKIACLQGDSGARLRLERWIEADRAGSPAAEPEASADLEAAARLFRLREKPTASRSAADSPDEEST